MLGGSGKIPSFSYDMSNLEMAINRKFINLILKQLSSDWQERLGADIEFDLHQIYSNPSSCELLLSHERCIVIRIEVDIGMTKGLMSIALPYESLNSVLDQLELASPEIPSSHSSTYLDLSNVDVELTAKLGDLELTKSDLQSLQIGDILSLGQKADTPIDIIVNGECCFLGNPCLKGINKGIIIKKPFKGVS